MIDSQENFSLICTIVVFIKVRSGFIYFLNKMDIFNLK